MRWLIEKMKWKVSKKESLNANFFPYKLKFQIGDIEITAANDEIRHQHETSSLSMNLNNLSTAKKPCTEPQISPDSLIQHQNDFLQIPSMSTFPSNPSFLPFRKLFLS